MKAIKLLVVLVVIVQLYSCGKDEEIPQEPKKSTLQPSQITLKRYNLVGGTERTYNLGYNSMGRLTSVNCSSCYGVNHTITYVNNKVSEITYNSSGGPTVTSFTYNESGKITNIEETGPEARTIISFTHNSENNSYALKLVDFITYIISVVLDNDGQITSFNDKPIVFDADKSGLFKETLGDALALSFALPSSVMEDLNYFSFYEMQSTGTSGSRRFLSNYERNSVQDIIAFRADYEDGDSYVEYTVTY